MLISRHYATDVWLLNGFRRQAHVVTTHRSEFHHNYATCAPAHNSRAVVLISWLQRLRATSASSVTACTARPIVACTVTPIISAGRFAARRRRRSPVTSVCHSLRRRERSGPTRRVVRSTSAQFNASKATCLRRESVDWIQRDSSVRGGGKAYVRVDEM